MNNEAFTRTGKYKNKTSSVEGFKCSIRSILIGLICVYLIVLLLALSYMTYRQYKIGIDEITHTAKVIRVFSVTEINRIIKNSKDILNKLGENRELRDVNPERCDNFLANFQKLQPSSSSLVIFDNSGGLACSALDSSIIQNVSSRLQAQLKEIQNTRKFSIGQPWQSSVNGRWFSAFIQPIIDEMGQIKGFIGLLVDLNRLQPFVSPFDSLVGTYSGIVNRAGTIVAASDNKELIGRKVIQEALQKSSGESEGTFRMTDYKQSRRFVSFESIPDSDWKLFVSIDVMSVLDPILETTLRRLFFLFLMLSFLTFITYKVTRLIVTPIESISRVLKRVTAGDYFLRVLPVGPAEIFQIATRINKMLDAREEFIQNLRQSEERFRVAFRTSPDALSITRLKDHVFLEVNDGFINKSGWSRDEIIGKSAKELDLWKWPHERQKLIRDLQNHGECAGLEAEFISKDGRIWAGVLSAHLIDLDGETCILSTTRDLTERNLSLELIHNLSFFDTLTGLPNRRLFMDRLQQVLNVCFLNKICGALILLNIDGFKNINDTLGHDVGDLMLKEVARRLQECSKKGEYLARIGGDEFAILLENVGTNDTKEAEIIVLEVCDQIHHSFNTPYHLKGSEYRRTVSLGVTLFGAEQEIALEPLRRVDLAINQAKLDGRNVTRLFESDMLSANSTDVSIEVSLSKAIETNQLELFYQAQVTNEGNIIGVEALVRWRDQQRGWVSPSQFIPIAEQTGLIVPLGHWVLETACRQIAKWDQSPTRLSQLVVAVNVSAKQFHQKHFVQQLRDVLLKTGARPDRLKLELTESTLILNISDISQKMRELKALGISFALDDFGTGYSALSYLKQLPFDQLKIDRSFVKDILIDKNDEAIAKMIVGLASSMNLSLIAEGVETEEQRQVLVNLGCNCFQGYLFCVPLSESELIDFVNKQTSI